MNTILEVLSSCAIDKHLCGTLAHERSQIFFNQGPVQIDVSLPDQLLLPPFINDIIWVWLQSFFENANSNFSFLHVGFKT